MDQSLRDAAEGGNIDALYAWIERDAEVLDRIDKIPFVETPLHIAASAGQTRFAMEFMTLKPSFARKLNQRGFTPMHLALQKLNELENKPDLQRNLTQLVDRLLDVDKDLVRVKGREGETPLHYVARTRNLSFLAKFFEVCPESFEDVTIRKETALHIVLKDDNVVAFRLLFGWVRRAWFKDALWWEKKVLYWQDEEGNTLLHIAVFRNQPEVVLLLLDRGLVDLKAKNLEGNTVFDILERVTQVDNQQIRNILRQYYCSDKVRSLVDRLPQRCVTFTRRVTSVEDYLTSRISTFEKLIVGLRRRQTVITDERRNALLVVAALLVTVTYQASLTLDQQPNQFNCTTPINATGADLFNCTASTNARTNFTFYEYIFLNLNTITYCLSSLTLCFLLPPEIIVGIGFVLYILLLLLCFCYLCTTPLSNAPIPSAICLVLALLMPWLFIAKGG